MTMQSGKTKEYNISNYEKTALLFLFPEGQIHQFFLCYSFVKVKLNKCVANGYFHLCTYY